MPATTITSKGRVTIPKVIRDAMGLRPGDRVRFVRRDDGTVVVEPETVDVRSLAGILKGKLKGPLTLEALEDAVERAVMEAMRR